MIKFPINSQVSNSEFDNSKLETNWRLATGNRRFIAGQSLFELVVAIAISALIIAAIVSLATNSIKNSTFSRNKTRAAAYAQEASEWLRGQRGSDVTTFIANAQATPSVWCLQALDWSSHHSCGDSGYIPNTIFKRDVTFSLVAADPKVIIEADVNVSWVDSQGTHEVINAINLADLR